MAIHTFKVRNFIRAKSEKRLRSLMFETQTKLGMVSLEFDQIYFANGYHYAWYYEILKNETLNEVVNDSRND